MARPLSTDARDKMLSAAQSIVMERGLDAYTIDAVAARSGVAKSTIYRHFASSNDLLLAALDNLVPEIHDVDTGVLRDDLQRLMQQFVALAQEPRIHQLFSSVLQRAALDPDFARLQLALVAERKTPMRRAIQRGIASGEIDPTIDIDTVAALFEGPMVARIMHDRGRFRPGEIELIVELVLKAVAPSTGH
jgi:AcrR family transcriptional regulator